MRKELEDYIWDRLGDPSDQVKWKRGEHRFPRDIIDEMIKIGMIQSPKQAWRTLEKWIGKGIYEYGSCLDLGWKCKPRKPICEKSHDPL